MLLDRLIGIRIQVDDHVVDTRCNGVRRGKSIDQLEKQVAFEILQDFYMTSLPRVEVMNSESGSVITWTVETGNIDLNDGPMQMQQLWNGKEMIKETFWYRKGRETVEIERRKVKSNWQVTYKSREGDFEERDALSQIAMVTSTLKRPSQ